MRNKVLDLLRGHYLVAILIDHLTLYPSIFEYYNGKGDLWVSAAEGFVFISGMLLAVVNLPKLAKYGFKYICKKLFNRALKLHLIGVFLTFAYSLIGIYLGTYPHLNEGILYENPLEILTQALLLQYSYGWADLLLFYAVLVFISPVILLALQKGYWKLVLSISFGLWFFEYLTPEHYKLIASYFPILAWQFMFVLGLIAGYFKPQISLVYRKLFDGSYPYFRASLVTLFIATLILSYLDTWYGHFPAFLDPITSNIFNKIQLGPGRILVFFLWFLGFYWFFHRFYWTISKYLGWLYAQYGENSLLTYIIQSVVLFISYYIHLNTGNPYLNIFWTVWVILLVWAIVGVLRSKAFKWLKI